MKSRFVEVNEAFVGAIRDGLTVADAATIVGVPVNTISTWLKNGRKDPDGKYGAFAKAVDAARESLPGETPMSDDEFEIHLANQIRRGSVQAMKLYLEWRQVRYGEGADEQETATDPLGFADELAARRSGRPEAS